jgi:hypothetical protein
MIIRTLDDLLPLVPEALRPQAALYAPVLLRWAVEDATALAEWVVLAVQDEEADYGRTSARCDGSGHVDLPGKRNQRQAEMSHDGDCGTPKVGRNLRRQWVTCASARRISSSKAKPEGWVMIRTH